MSRYSFSRSICFRKSKLALAIAGHMLLTTGNALGAPADGVIVGGVGTIEQQGPETKIVQSSDRLAIDWQSFDIGKTSGWNLCSPGRAQSHSIGFWEITALRFWGV